MPNFIRVIVPKVKTVSYTCGHSETVPMGAKEPKVCYRDGQPKAETTYKADGAAVELKEKGQQS